MRFLWYLILLWNILINENNVVEVFWHSVGKIKNSPLVCSGQSFVHLKVMILWPFVASFYGPKNIQIVCIFINIQHCLLCWNHYKEVNKNFNKIKSRRLLMIHKSYNKHGTDAASTDWTLKWPSMYFHVHSVNSITLHYFYRENKRKILPCARHLP